MANLVESIIDKVKLPDKIELSHADRQLLLKLSASVEELKTRKALTDAQLNAAEERLNTQMQRLFEEAANRPSEPAQPPEINIDLTDLKHFISEETEQKKYQLKACIEDKYNDTTSQFKALKGMIKDDEILSKLPTLCNQLSDMEILITRQMRTVKIMLGITIWVCILTLAVAVAHVLGYI